MRPWLFAVVLLWTVPAGAEQKVPVPEAFAKATTFEERSRLAEALGRTEEEAADIVISPLFEKPAGDAESIAIRRMIMIGMHKNLTGWAESIIERGAKDPDPGVRIASVGALSGRSRGKLSLMKLATEDEWPEVRRVALAAMVASVDPTGLAFALSIAADRKQTYEMRTYAVTLIAAEDSARAAPAFIQGFSQVEEEAARTEKAHPLFRQVIALLGRSKNADALPQLLRIAGAFPAPTVRGEAILALGQFCTKEALAEIARAQKDPQREVELAGKRAAATCSAR